MAQLQLTRYDVHQLNNNKVSAFPVKYPAGASLGWDDISLYYAKALKKMGWRKSPNGNTDVTSMWPESKVPNSYFFQAAMHWWPKHPRVHPPAPDDAYWSHCTHGPMESEQYFLPWHRLYIYFFEVIVRSYVAQLGGPQGWALPYWNYSYYNASDPSGRWPRSNLPWVFRQPTLPDDGSDNPLYIADTAKRGLQPTWPGTQKTMYLNSTTPYYDEAYDCAQFLGPFDTGFNKTLDQTPHGAVHGDVGTGNGRVGRTGWMANTVTASFDPIFWLHHSEIDRFWVGWNAAGHPNPSDSTWLNAEDDELHDTRWNFWSDGNLQNKRVLYPKDVLDPANLNPPFPYSYKFQDLPQTPPPRPTGPADVAAALPSLAARAAAVPSTPEPPAAVAAADGPIELGKEPVSTSVSVPQQAQDVVARLDLAAQEPEEPRVILYLEGITSTEPAANYEVYLNQPNPDREPPGADPQYVGLLASFGADHEHDHEAEEGGHEGISASFDITQTVAYLRAHGGWNEREATVTFVPAGSPPEGFELQTPPLQVANISIHTV